jgi:hypothetical protein
MHVATSHATQSASVTSRCSPHPATRIGRVDRRYWSKVVLSPPSGGLTLYSRRLQGSFLEIPRNRSVSRERPKERAAVFQGEPGSFPERDKCP